MYKKILKKVQEMDERGEVSGWEIQDRTVVVFFAPSRESTGWIKEISAENGMARTLHLATIGFPTVSEWSDWEQFV